MVTYSKVLAYMSRKIQSILPTVHNPSKNSEYTKIKFFKVHQISLAIKQYLNLFKKQNFKTSNKEKVYVNFQPATHSVN